MMPYIDTDIGQHWFVLWYQATTWTNIDLSSVASCDNEN